MIFHNHRSLLKKTSPCIQKYQFDITGLPKKYSARDQISLKTNPFLTPLTLFIRDFGIYCTVYNNILVRISKTLLSFKAIVYRPFLCYKPAD
jgi:hypothetical protein